MKTRHTRLRSSITDCSSDDHADAIPRLLARYHTDSMIHRTSTSQSTSPTSSGNTLRVISPSKTGSMTFAIHEKHDSLQKVNFCESQRSIINSWGHMKFVIIGITLFGITPRTSGPRILPKRIAARCEHTLHYGS
jgi:hypothetical protein